MKLFTSDLHFGHANIIKYSNRPFQTVDEMNKAIIDNWNAIVQPGDEVYFLGDFAFGDKKLWEYYANQLKGNIYLVKGNHDEKLLKLVPNRFAWAKDYHEERIDGQLVVMCHYPMMQWHDGQHGSFMLHGHTHGTIDKENEPFRRLDVGLDGFGKLCYSPRSWQDVKDELLKPERNKMTHCGR